MKQQAFVLFGAFALAACGGGSGPSLNTLSGLAGQSAASLVDPEAEQTYATISATQKLVIGAVQAPGDPEPTVRNSLYEGEQPIGTNSLVQITYDPRDATFDIKLDAASVDWEGRFQDPLHRTNNPQNGTPLPANVEYYESGSNTDTGFEANTLFFETPGTTTRYVTYAGFFRRIYNETEGTDNNNNPITEISDEYIRSTFVYGLRTPRTEVPTRGTADYSGPMFAFIIGANGNRDLSHIIGTSSTSVNFENGSVSTSLSSGTGSPVSFSATGSANLSSTREGFSGSIVSATLNGNPVSMAASSLEGNFFGPAAAEVGGAFRIVGGIPDTRLDILGSFIGAKP